MMLAYRVWFRTCAALLSADGTAWHRHTCRAENRIGSIAGGGWRVSLALPVVAS